MSDTTNLPQWIADDIAAHLDEIRRYFKSSKVTLLVRNPDVSDADVLLTDDDLRAAIEAMQHVERTGQESEAQAA